MAKPINRRTLLTNSGLAATALVALAAEGAAAAPRSPAALVGSQPDPQEKSRQEPQGPRPQGIEAVRQTEFVPVSLTPFPPELPVPQMFVRLRTDRRGVVRAMVTNLPEFDLVVAVGKPVTTGPPGRKVDYTAFRLVSDLQAFDPKRDLEPIPWDQDPSDHIRKNYRRNASTGKLKAPASPELAIGDLILIIGQIKEGPIERHISCSVKIVLAD